MKIFISPRSRLATVLPVIAALLFVFPQRALSAAPVTPTISSVTESTNAAYGAGTLTVNWNAVSGATSYAAMITKQGTSETPTVITNEDSTNLQATFRNLPGGTTYIVQVKAFTGVESSPWSSATRTAIPKTFPKAPAKPTVVKGIGRATVSWTALTASEKGGYEVTSYLVTELNSSKTVTATGTSTEAIVTGLTNGATVEFTVAAITAAGAAGSTSDKSDKYILDDVPSTPSAPVLTTTDTSGEVKATWTAPTNDNGSSLISYTIKLFKDGIERTSEIITKIADTFYTFTSLLNGTYTSKVLATNGVGDSALSVFSNQIVIGSSASPTPTPSPTSSASPSATPSASPSASPSPSPSPTETSAPAPPSFGGGFGGGGGGGFGGGFGGGGALPDAVVPLVTPSPIPSPTITPSAPAQIVPTLAPTSTARPSAIPTPSKPTPSGSVTPRPIPSPTQLPKIKSNSFIAPVQITTTTQRVVATSIKMTQNIKAGKSLSVTLPPVKKGTNVTVNVKTPDGKVIAIKTETLKKSGSYTLPALAFKKTGTYQVIVKIGSKFKTVTVKVAK